MENYTYGMDDILFRTFMMPAVMPNNTNLNTQMNMLDNASVNANFNNQNMMNKNNKFLSPKEGFLRGNMEAGTYIPYKNMTYLKPNINNQRQNDLYKLQEMAFAAHDINLYLDTHPTDARALALHREYCKCYKEAVEKYQKKFGPLSIFYPCNKWRWLEQPWPWEGGNF